ncbi:MAG: cobalt transporter [Deltaproteobacteria bacterium]|nr:MAG: cobalt transporter [Deltaproteobacteria bacterium]PIE73110.1 MAG: cobalt transporter [Deltaproteobacteria bacterium]
MSGEKSSPVLLLDVRSKMFICLVASTVVIFFKGEVALSFFTLISFCYALSTRRWRLLAICYALAGLMWLISIGFVYLLHSISETFPLSSLVSVLIPFLRSLVMLNTVLVLALTSRIQTLLSALKGLRLPIWLYIPAAVVIRFIPDFINDISQIHETMRTRGYNLNPLFLIRHPLLTVRLLIAPMLFRALRSADELAIAAELKGIRHDVKMTSYRVHAFSRYDAFALFIVVCTIVCGISFELAFDSMVKGRMM